MSKRTFVIGDIHGCADALSAVLESIDPQNSDTIITLGDYVDRGPDAARVLDRLTDLVSECILIPLLGNHELMMAGAMNRTRDTKFWLSHGGKMTLNSYGGNMAHMPPSHRTFLSHCKRYYETDTHIFVHASYDPSLPLDQQSDELLFWQHVDAEYPPQRHFSGKTVVCGHTPQMDGEVCDLGHILLLDTYCFGGQWLTAYELGSGEMIQADMSGRLRDRPRAARRIDFSSTFPISTTQQALTAKLEGQESSTLELDGSAFKNTIGKGRQLPGGAIGHARVRGLSIIRTLDSKRLRQ